MEEVLNVFRVVEGRRGSCGLGCFLLVPWLSRVDSFPYAELSKVGEADLQFAHGLCPGDEIFRLTRDPFLLDSCHFGVKS